MEYFIVLLQLTLTILYIAVGVFGAGWIGKLSIRIGHYVIHAFVSCLLPSILTCSV